jgi:hypothetical protein
LCADPNPNAGAITSTVVAADTAGHQSILTSEVDRRQGGEEIPMRDLRDKPDAPTYSSVAEITTFATILAALTPRS